MDNKKTYTMREVIKITENYGAYCVHLHNAGILECSGHKHDANVAFRSATEAMRELPSRLVKTLEMNEQVERMRRKLEVDNQ